MKVYVVVLNWNGKDLIKPCLDSLQSQTYPAEIVVVDNGSSDGSVEYIESKFPDVQLIKKSANHGFAGGVNIGIKHALKNGAEAVALFNNDAVAEPVWLEHLVRAMNEEKTAAIVTGRLMQMDKIHLDSTGDFYTTWGMPFPRGRNQKAAGNFEHQEFIFAASGGASLYRAKALHEIGLFDENFFAYFEDVDISFRAQLAGWTVIYIPDAVAYHHISATSSRMGSFSRYHSIKNFYILYAKNMPAGLFWKYLPLFLLHGLRLAVSSLVRGGFIAYLRGCARAVLLLPDTLKARKLIQGRRRVPVSYIDGLLTHSRPRRIPPISKG